VDSTDEVVIEVEKKPKKDKIEYDGYYIVESVDINNRKTSVYSRGHKLKSWLNFEKSLKMNVTSTYRIVSQQEYDDHHWSTYAMTEGIEEKKSKRIKKVKNVNNDITNFMEN